VTTADAEQTTVAAFRPWRGSWVRIPWALAAESVAQGGDSHKANLAADRRQGASA